MYIIYKALVDQVEYLEDYIEDLNLPVFGKHKFDAKKYPDYGSASTELERIRNSVSSCYTMINMKYIRE